VRRRLVTRWQTSFARSFQSNKQRQSVPSKRRADAHGGGRSNGSPGLSTPMRQPIQDTCVIPMTAERETAGPVPLAAMHATR